MATRSSHFDSKFLGSDDPWRYCDSWYERRKRALILACLPRENYGNAFEPGCANGVLSADLASRCTRLFCADVAPRAVALARTRLAAHGHARVECLDIPREWPDDESDLIVISELAYYLAREELQQLTAALQHSLQSEATVLCCHWRGAQDNWPIPVQHIHAAIGGVQGLHPIAHHTGREFVLNVWSTDPRSVAQREFLE